MFTIEIERFDEDGNSLTASAENLISAIENKFIKIGLNQNLHNFITFTTDQGKNIVKALQHHRRINCMAHLLNNILTHTFNDTFLKENAPTIYNLILKTKQLVEHLKRTGITQILQTTVKQDCPTRWNTKYDMLYSVHANFNDIEIALIQSGAQNKLCGVDKYLLKEVIKFLKPFKANTLAFEGDSEPTIHLVMLYMHILRTKIASFATEMQELTVVAQNCLTIFDNIFARQYSQNSCIFVARV